MKTINSEEKDYEVFLGPNNEYLGFAGKVQIHDSEVYVDTRTGKGYDEVLKKLDRLIRFLASKYRFKGFTNEDSRQHISMRIIEGIPKFDPRKEVKLSTFIQMRVNRRLINELRDERHMSKNATLLNVNSYNHLCSCGHSFILVISEDDACEDKVCEKCHASVKSARRVSVGFSEVSLDSHFSNIREGEGDEDTGDFELLVANDNCFEENDIILKYDMDNWLKGEDPTIVKLVELVLLRDYSISKAAKEVGLSNAGANSKLKGLKNNKIIREMLGR